VNLTQLSIAVIDENLDRAALIDQGLREAGHTAVHVISSMKGVIARIAELSPDVIVMDLGTPNRDVLEHMFRLSRAVQKPVAMFVDRSDEQAMLDAIEAGVSAYIVDGLKKDRVKAILDLAILRFRAFERMRAERDSARQALDDRKLIDRAKGLIMTLKAVDEAQAYALLRETAMRQNRKLAEIAQAVILAAELTSGGGK
jgi:response regulator NasT